MAFAVSAAVLTLMAGPRPTAAQELDINFVFIAPVVVQTFRPTIRMTGIPQTVWYF